jgi:hypothetical protein
MLDELEAAALDADAARDALRVPIEINRRRSERNRRPRPPAAGHVHNGHRSDVRLFLTSNDLIIRCLRCGREVRS